MKCFVGFAGRLGKKERIYVLNSLEDIRNTLLAAQDRVERDSELESVEVATQRGSHVKIGINVMHAQLHNIFCSSQ